MTSPVDIRPDHLEIVQDVLRKHLPLNVKVWVFGSRAHWTTKDSSDLDLALEGESKLSYQVLGSLKDAFEDSALPYTVDVVDLNRIGDSFRQIVESQKVRLPGRNGRRRTVKLGDVATVIMGQSPPGSTVSDHPGVALLNGPTEFGPHHPVPIQFTTAPRKFAQPGDVLFCVRGSTTGRMNWADQEYAIGRGVAAIRHAEDLILQPLLRGAIEVALPDLLIAATGSTFPNVSASQIAEIPYPDLSVKEQRAVAHVLGTLDDKIELNRRMNKTLEAMARALFKSWFVDFDPVRAKMDGRWLRGESLPGLPAKHYDLFPDRLVDSAMGEIPEGWEVKPLDGIATFLNGLALQKYPPTTDGSALPVVKIAQLRMGHTFGADLASDDLPEQYLVHDGDVLFSWSGSLDLVIWAGGEGVLNQHLFKVTSETYPQWLYYHWIREHLPYFQNVAAGKATTMGHIQRHHLTEALAVIPSTGTLCAMDQLMQPLSNLSLALRLESRVLAAQRDALLPRLVSGEMRAKDSERLLTEETM